MVEWLAHYIVCVDKRSGWSGMSDVGFGKVNSQMEGMAVRLASIQSKSHTKVIIA
jgi:hypothetical protein